MQISLDANAFALQLLSSLNAFNFLDAIPAKNLQKSCNEKDTLQVIRRENQLSLTVISNSQLAGGPLWDYMSILYIHTHTHIPTFSIWGLSFIMLKISFSELYETQHLFPNKLINVPCGALQYLFARGGLSVFENNYKNELQMVLLSRYNRCYFGLTNMNCGREKSDTHKAEQSIYSVICVFFSGLFKYHTLNSREREKINKPL